MTPPRSQLSNVFVVRTHGFLAVHLCEFVHPVIRYGGTNSLGVELSIDERG